MTGQLGVAHLARAMVVCSVRAAGPRATPSPTEVGYASPMRTQVVVTVAINTSPTVDSNAIVYRATVAQVLRRPRADSCRAHPDPPRSAIRQCTGDGGERVPQRVGRARRKLAGVEPGVKGADGEGQPKREAERRERQQRAGVGEAQSAARPRCGPAHGGNRVRPPGPMLVDQPVPRPVRRSQRHRPEFTTGPQDPARDGAATASRARSTTGGSPAPRRSALPRLLEPRPIQRSVNRGRPAMGRRTVQLRTRLALWDASGTARPSGVYASICSPPTTMARARRTAITALRALLVANPDGLLRDGADQGTGAAGRPVVGLLFWVRANHVGDAARLALYCLRGRGRRRRRPGSYDIVVMPRDACVFPGDPGYPDMPD